VFLAIISLVLGIIIVLLQYFQLVMITPSLAYPVIFSIENVLIVMGLSRLALLLPYCK
jgi:lipoprotein-releasing system permease protein